MKKFEKIGWEIDEEEKLKRIIGIGEVMRKDKKCGDMCGKKKDYENGKEKDWKRVWKGKYNDI